jgi:hypothetical protein
VSDESGIGDGTREALARRLAEGLGLLEDGRVEDARRELASLLTALRGGGIVEVASPAPPALGAALEEIELDRAFSEATPETDAMRDADDVAQEAMREAELDAPEGVLPISASPFATRTVADLLERQGHADAADRLRAEIGSRGSSPSGPSGSSISPQRARVVSTLERWLQNLQRGTA